MATISFLDGLLGFVAGMLLVAACFLSLRPPYKIAGRTTPDSAAHHDGNKAARRPDKLRDALHTLHEMDRYNNWYEILSIFSFFISAWIGVRAFFIMSDLIIGDGMSDRGALLATSLSWMMLFLVWIVVFLGILFLLNAVGVKDLRSIARDRLSALILSLDELLELRNILTSRNWKNGPVFRSVVAGLAER